MADSRFFRTPDLPGRVVPGTIAVAADLTFDEAEAAKFEASIRQIEQLEDVPETQLNTISLR